MGRDGAPLSQVNRVMLLTAPGAAAIAAFRISGPKVPQFLAEHFSKAVDNGHCVHGELRDGQTVLDDPVVVKSQDGSIADINVHGGPWVVSSVLKLIQQNGFQHHPPREPHLPIEVLDMLDGKTTLEREVWAYLPLAKTEQAVRVLLGQPQAWAELIERTQTSDAIRRVVIEAIERDQSMTWLLHAPRVAIVGAPNVGKSTLANQLFGQQRSITADIPGTTRDWVGEIANIDGLPVILIDTPGLRDTADAVEKAAIEKSRRMIDFSALLIVVRDPFHPVDAQAELPRGIRSLLVVNKSDEMRKRGMSLGLRAYYTVATTGEGVDTLRDAIRRHFECLDLDPNRPRCWTPRQREILRRAIDTPAVLPEILNG